MSSRYDGRQPDDLRPFSFVRDFTSMTMGSTLVTFGETRVLCTASVEEDVPRWMKGKGEGWVTAEYSMLPGSSPERVNRERRGAKGRTQEIERLIGRSLRAVTDMTALGENSIRLDCDVLQADGGTRTAAICGAYVALHDACQRLVMGGAITRNPLTTECAAVSVGIVDGRPVLDLPYPEDSTADADFNVVMAGNGELIEVQGTAEGNTFSRAELDAMLDLAEAGIATIIAAQRSMLAEPPSPRARALTMAEPSLPQLVCASANPAKAAEIALVLDGLIELLPRPEELADVVEDAPDLEGNARLKAAAVCAAAGAAAVSDDTGLEVDALGGAPGVRSARYAGEDATDDDNVQKLLDELVRVGAIEPADRTARFRTVVMVVWPDGSELAAEGVVEGVIAPARQGSGGFGYDPVFVPTGRDGRSFAEMGAEKHEISHRGRALRALAEALAN